MTNQKKENTDLFDNLDDIGIYLFSNNEASDISRSQNSKIMYPEIKIEESPIRPDKKSSKTKQNIKEKGKYTETKNQAAKLNIKKCTGRWKCKQHLLYMEILRIYHLDQKQLFKVLQQELPWRSMPQIRAHHQKMMNKFGSVRLMLRAYPNKDQNLCLMDISRQLEETQTILDIIGRNLTEIMNEKQQ